MVDEPTAAVDDAVSVSVDLPLSAVSVAGLPLQVAVTPTGSPLTLKLTVPLKVLLPVKAMASVTVAPCITAREVDAGAAVSVGGVCVTVMGRVKLVL